MNYSSSKRGFPAGNPIANALVIIVGAMVIGVSIVLGFVAFVILSSVVLIFAAIVGIRLWWFDRKMKKASASGTPGQRRPDSPRGVIEGEYHEIIEKQDASKP